MSGAPEYVALIPLPFEATTSFLTGTIHGPAAILRDLERMDTFDFELGRDPFGHKSYSVIRPHGTETLTAQVQQSLAYRAVFDVLEQGGFPICLGGEHTVSLGPIRAARSQGEIGVIQLDAHADLRNEYEGDLMSHACVMRRVLEMSCPTLAIGVRAISKGEAEVIQDGKLLQVSDRQAMASEKWYELLDALPSRIYLTVDMDVFEPAEVSAVGTPEPGGLSYEVVCDFLRRLFKLKHVVAADVVELMPGSDDAASIRTAARLVSFVAGLKC